MKTTVSPNSFLDDLRTEVLNHSDMRMPRWKFRLAPDLVMDLQPSSRLVSRGAKRQMFNGFALMAEGADKAMLLSAKARHDRGVPYWMTKLSIVTEIEPERPWEVLTFGGRWKHDAGREGVEILQRRVEETFSCGFFDRLTAAAMLHPFCLICGKALSDPASMARRIGPECAGTSSLRVPWLINVSKAA
jgi:hypothetical protein